jgi:predicted small metal-binding protein
MVKHVKCRDAGYDCDFEIYDENEDELVQLVREHASNTHDKEVSSDDVRGMMHEA